MKKFCFLAILVLNYLSVYCQSSSESNIAHYSIKTEVSISESLVTNFNIVNHQVQFSESTPRHYSIVNSNSKSNESASTFYKIGPTKTDLLSKSHEPSELINITIPVSTEVNRSSYALIIGNEDYKSHQPSLNYEQNVEYALNDARLFREICNKTLGVPAENIIYLENATYAKTKQAIEQIELICKHSKTKPSIFFYYSGHGLPEETTRIPHIIPVDVSGNNINFGISLPELYKSLTKYPVEKAIVVLDACFTGDARNSGLVSSRAVRVRPKENVLYSRILVFSASSSDQPSKSYKEKGHGLFTYYLTRKIIESNGNITLGELDEYIVGIVPVKSALINQCEQVPQTNVSNEILNEWKNWTLK